MPAGVDLRYLTIEQALADTATFLADKENVLGCEAKAPVVLFGGSYGGMLAAWSRLKYPHISAGALAASAPVDLYPGENKAGAFFNATLGVFQQYGSPSCASAIQAGLEAVAAAGKTAAGRQNLTTDFQVCQPNVATSGDVQRLLFYIKGAVTTLAMLSYPYPQNFVTPMPGYPLKVACSRLAAAPTLLKGIDAVVDVFLNYTGQLPCHNISMEMVGAPGSALSARLHGSADSIYSQWNYQVCTELILEPLTSDGFGFFVEDAKQVPQVEAACRERYPSVVTRPQWMRQAFGTGAEIVAHTTNMIFSDGDRDPWTIGGVPLNATSPDGSVFHILIKDAAHHQDLRTPDPLDSPALTAARAVEAAAIRKWIGYD